MTSQTGKQIIKIHILSNISRSKDNEAMKFEKYFFFKNEAWRLVIDTYF